MPAVSEYETITSLNDCELAPPVGQSGSAPPTIANGDAPDGTEKAGDDEDDSECERAVRLYCSGGGGRLWQYRAEGGANIVVGLPRRRCVLRFPKWTRPGPEQEAAAERRLRRLADYRNLLMGRLLPDDSRQPWQVVCVPAVERDRLVADIETARPVRRRGYTISSSGLAMLMEDCAVLPTPSQPTSTVFSIEIKTKQGFLAADDEPGYCSFCMKQLVKVARGAVPRHSLYCPLDLFSGEFGRVERALHALLDTPQNNLRVFVDGEYVLGGERREGRRRLLEAVAGALPRRSDAPAADDRLIQLWTHLMYSALCAPAGQTSPPPPPGRQPAGARCQPGAGPPADSVLGRLLAGQRLCAAGPTTATQLYQTLTASGAGRRRLQATFAAPYDSAAWTAVCSGDAAAGGDPVWLLQRYCVGATLRDCSLMVTLRRLADDEPAPAGAPGRLLTDADGGRWLCLCRLMDLDEKQPERAPRQLAKKQRARRLHARLSGQRRLSDRQEEAPAAAARLSSSPA